MQTGIEHSVAVVINSLVLGWVTVSRYGIGETLFIIGNAAKMEDINRMEILTGQEPAR